MKDKSLQTKNNNKMKMHELFFKKTFNHMRLNIWSQQESTPHERTLGALRRQAVKARRHWLRHCVMFPVFLMSTAMP